jgi:hypothetical protein
VTCPPAPGTSFPATQAPARPFEDRVAALQRQSSVSSETLGLRLPFLKLRLGSQFTQGLIWHLAQIVPEPSRDGDLLLLFPPLEKLFPYTEADIRRREVPDALVAATAAPFPSLPVFPLLPRVHTAVCTPLEEASFRRQRGVSCPLKWDRFKTCAPQ